MYGLFISVPDIEIFRNSFQGIFGDYLDFLHSSLVFRNKFVNILGLTLKRRMISASRRALANLTTRPSTRWTTTSTRKTSPTTETTSTTCTTKTLSTITSTETRIFVRKFRRFVCLKSNHRPSRTKRRQLFSSNSCERLTVIAHCLARQLWSVLIQVWYNIWWELIERKKKWESWNKNNVLSKKEGGGKGDRGRQRERWIYEFSCSLKVL